MLPFTMGSALTGSGGAATASSFPWAGIGSFLGGMGQFAGGASGLFGGDHVKKWDEHDYRRMINQHWGASMANAKKYGIHPLVAVGIKPGSGPTAHAAPRSGTGGALTSMGQALTRMSAVGMSEVQKAQIANLNAQTRLINSQANEIKTKSPAGQAGPGVITNSNLPLKHPSYASGDQEGRAVKGLYQLYRHHDGSILKIPAEDAADYLSESVVDAALLQGKRWWRNLTRRRNKMTPGQLRTVRDELDDIEFFMRQNGELRPDEYLQFSYQMGLPKVTRSMQGRRKTLFTRKGRYESGINFPRYGGHLFRRN